MTYQLQRRGITPQRTRQAAKEVAGNQTDTPWEQYVKARNYAERTAFRRSATDLRTAATKLSPTERTKIETAATELEQFAAQMPVAKTRRQQMREALTKHQQQKSSIEKEHEDRER